MTTEYRTIDNLVHVMFDEEGTLRLLPVQCGGCWTTTKPVNWASHDTTPPDTVQCLVQHGSGDRLVFSARFAHPTSLPSAPPF